MESKPGQKQETHSLHSLAQFFPASGPKTHKAGFDLCNDETIHTHAHTHTQTAILTKMCHFIDR